MNTLEYLLACLGEECGEVQQEVGKSLRFGINDRHPEKDTTNFQYLKKKLHDIVATYRMVCNKINEDSSFDEDMILEKKLKVIKLMDYSRELGHLEPLQEVEKISVFTSWKGGLCPLDEFVGVEVLLKDGEILSGMACGFNWTYFCSVNRCIVGYRVI